MHAYRRRKNNSKPKIIKVEDVNSDKESIDELVEENIDNDSSLLDNDCSFSPDDSTNSKEVGTLYERIDSLICQNEVNIQRIYTLECKDEQRRKELLDKDVII